MISTVPAVGAMSPVTILIEVVLPARFGPRKPKISPRPTAKPTPRTASTRLRVNGLRYVFARPVARRTTSCGASVTTLFLDDPRVGRRGVRLRVLVELVLDLARADAEHGGGLGGRPAAGLEGLQDGVALEIGDGRPGDRG